MKRRIYLLLAVLISASAFGQTKSNIEKQLEQIGLQNVAEQIPGIEVYMVYATPYNFMGRVLYNDLDEAYLVPEAIEKLRKANELLRKRRMDLHLVVYDAARPRSIQEQMWKVVENTDLQSFVANPYRSGGGPHNYGIAVDVTLVDCTGHPIYPYGLGVRLFRRSLENRHRASVAREGRDYPSRVGKSSPPARDYERGGLACRSCRVVALQRDATCRGEQEIAGYKVGSA